jgi:hypothetical protein
MSTWLKELPIPIRLAAGGLAATVLLVITAIAVRTSPHEALEEDAPPVASARDVPAHHDGAASGPKPRAGRAGAEPTSTAERPAPPPILAADARAVREKLRKELQFGRFKTALDALAELLELAPSSPQDPEVRADIVELSMRVMLLTGGEPDRMFDLVTTKMGTTGIDILYELLTTRGGSRAAARAEELLKDETIRARGTPAVRIAYELRVTSGCDQKKALFPRAASDGDGRTLGQLQLLNRRCGRHSGTCCLQNDPDLRQTMDAIKARIGG